MRTFVVAVMLIIVVTPACSSTRPGLAPTANWSTCESWTTTPVTEKMLQQGCKNAAGELTSARLIPCDDGRSWFVGEDFEGWLGGYATPRDPRAPRGFSCPS